MYEYGQYLTAKPGVCGVPLETRVVAEGTINKLTGKPLEAWATLGYPAVQESTIFVNTIHGGFPASCFNE